MNWNYTPKLIRDSLVKKQLLAILFLIGLTIMAGCQNNRNNTETKNSRVQDSILIFKTDTTKFYSLTSINPETGKWKPVINQKVNYHKIDTKEKSLTFFFQLKNQTDWGIRKMNYDSLSVNENGISFYYNSDYFISSFLDTLNSKTIAHVLDNDHYIRFTNLKRVENSELESLKLKKETIDSYQKYQVYSNQ
ncbi:hypothetical protein [Luteirhabdus pelagi]|uniref:hypothetical protein n=1 Tax=Luteirhabdus pelagi TaxID=2792783 RepID=UPI00193AA2BF|nr:hypothetical protein [Luteirhabdus pelagi]